MDKVIKIYFKAPVWQRRFMDQILKEQRNANPNEELLEKAKKACLKTEDENFIFLYAFYVANAEYKKEAIEYLLKVNPKEWAIPCAKEAYCTLNNRYKCRDALISQYGGSVVLDFAKEFGL